MWTADTTEIIADSTFWTADGGEAFSCLELANLPTQYRKAYRLQGLLHGYLEQVEQAVRFTDVIPEYFDLDTAIGDQLAIIGGWLGFPRCHCICTPTRMFGFACPDMDYPAPIVGFCEGGNWLSCDGGSLGEYCVNDDEVYRSFLKARRYQMLGLFDRESLTAAIRHIWGPTAWIVRTGQCEVVVSPGRALADTEKVLTQIVGRVLPIAPGIALGFWTDTRPIFGFGDGWVGLCTNSSESVFGFDCGGTYGYQVSGFCAPSSTWANCANPNQSAGVWLCPDDPRAPC